jgi:hypothetical protein
VSHEDPCDRENPLSEFAAEVDSITDTGELLWALSSCDDPSPYDEYFSGFRASLRGRIAQLFSSSLAKSLSRRQPPADFLTRSIVRLYAEGGSAFELASDVGAVLQVVQEYGELAENVESISGSLSHPGVRLEGTSSQSALWEVDESELALAAEKGLRTEIYQTLELIDEYFEAIESVSLTHAKDPGTGDFSFVIELLVGGEVDDVINQYDAYSAAFLDTLSESAQDHVGLSLAVCE